MKIEEKKFVERKRTVEAVPGLQHSTGHSILGDCLVQGPSAVRCETTDIPQFEKIWQLLDADGPSAVAQPRRIMTHRSPFKSSFEPGEGASWYSWIARQLQVGTSLGRCHNLVRFQI